jgi:hypothetical protein
MATIRPLAGGWKHLLNFSIVPQPIEQPRIRFTLANPLVPTTGKWADKSLISWLEEDLKSDKLDTT